MATPRIDPDVNLRCSQEEVLMAVEWGLGRWPEPNQRAAEMVLRLRRQLDPAAMARIRAKAAGLTGTIAVPWEWLLVPPPPTAPERVPDGPVTMRGFTVAISALHARRVDQWATRAHWVRGSSWPPRRKQDTLCGHVNTMVPLTYTDRPRPVCQRCQDVLDRALAAPAWPT